jgi:hypothetical protein
LLAYGTAGTIKLARQTAALRKAAAENHLASLQVGKPAE